MHTKLPDKSQQIFRFNGGSQCSRNIWLIIYKIHYLKHLGNRDTASFTKVVESQPYGDELNPVKLECVGYYQKRTGNGSQHNRKDLKGVKNCLMEERFQGETDLLSKLLTLSKIM